MFRTFRNPRSATTLSALCAAMALAGCLSPHPARAQFDLKNSFPFAMPWDDATKNAIDVSDLNPAPVTEQQRIVARDGHFYDQTGRRVRFLGVNFVYSTNFPDKVQAEKMAARLHKFGINIVRLHHMDTLRAPNGIFAADAKDTSTLDPDQLDRLDYLVSQLKQHGIYVDLNLLVGRRINTADGLADTWGLPNFAKVVSWFSPQVIELQKQYAKALINRVNPYTKLRYADDPAVALIEINNEDTILGPGRAEVLRQLPDSYRKPFQDGWNRFLAQKYGTTAKMLAAWNVGAIPYSENFVTNPRFAAGTEGWQLEGPPGAAQISAEDISAGPPATSPPGRALHLQLAAPATAAAPVQVQFPGLSLKRGTVYRVQFWAKASVTNRNLNVNVRLARAPWSSLGLIRGIQLAPQWKRFNFNFTAAADVPAGAKLAFTLTDGPAGDIWLADVTLQSGNAVELPAGQNLEAANLELPLISATGQGTDYSAYTMDVEARYVETMRSYIRETLGAKSMITCSQGGWGGLGGMLRESRLDYVDMHAYWDLANATDSRVGTISNRPMVRETDGATLSTLAMNRVAGKPYTVSEYNHNSPNDYSAEGLPMLASFAAWQDWDGIFLFDYHSNRQTLTGNDKLQTLLDIDSSPAKMAYFPAAARIFLGGSFPPAPAGLTYVVPRSGVPGLMAQNAGAIWKMWNALGVKNTDMLRARTAVRFVDEGTAPRIETEGTVPAAPRLSWQGGKTGVATYKVAAPAAWFLIGFPGPSNTVDGLTVAPAKPDSFLALTLSSRDNKPIRESASLLLTAGSYFENANMGWNATRTSVGDKWGDGPVRAEGVAAAVTLETAARTAEVFALDTTGTRTIPVPSQLKDGKLTFTIDPRYQAVWYEIAARP